MIPTTLTFDSFEDFAAYTKIFEINGEWFISFEIDENAGTVNFKSIDEMMQIEEVIIPATVEKINENAFISSLVKKVTISSPEIEIANDAFYSCVLLGEVSFEGTTSAKIGREAFRECVVLSELNNIPTTLILGEGTFRNCALTELILENVNFQEYMAFAENDNLEKLVITGNLTWIGDSFRDCPNLEQAWLPESYAQSRYNGTYADTAFLYTDSSNLKVYIYIPEGWTNTEKTQAESKISKGSEQWIWSDDTENWENP